MNSGNSLEMEYFRLQKVFSFQPIEQVSFQPIQTLLSSHIPPKVLFSSVLLSRQSLVRYHSISRQTAAFQRQAATFKLKFLGQTFSPDLWNHISNHHQTSFSGGPPRPYTQHSYLAALTLRRSYLCLDTSFPLLGRLWNRFNCPSQKQKSSQISPFFPAIANQSRQEVYSPLTSSLSHSLFSILEFQLSSFLSCLLLLCQPSLTVLNLQPDHQNTSS